jgi:hypothetical protein
MKTGGPRQYAARPRCFSHPELYISVCVCVCVVGVRACVESSKAGPWVGHEAVDGDALARVGLEDPLEQVSEL